MKNFAQLINSIMHGKVKKPSLKLNGIIQNFLNNISTILMDKFSSFTLLCISVVFPVTGC